MDVPGLVLQRVWDNPLAVQPPQTVWQRGLPEWPCAQLLLLPLSALPQLLDRLVPVDHPEVCFVTAKKMTIRKK